ncbi:MAG: phosphoglycerate dehydrogenase [Deltaproteobacteria bacterium]|nr:phosphoglycerate dehydrogenase [Deltaproteobacteria bacterium]MBW1924927.1 phosphoglycerate dehydrogenase [Deltaproteobacteria bacterium]MBW1949419.1 phosphoglycerate dehydrogenase [Deltaproteobacteria bacterium]MBW2008267.1 phosphoglycerate dehydrogenase [Deltaproteobacteria bacterium]MBW2103776.1 phosphoglycerate dehydrogenase [Deltaproteobacteria bacterium]
MKVLVSDPLSEVGVRIFEETPGIEVDVNTGLTPEELQGVIGRYDALVIRSATRVTADVIEKARNLKVIGRAGIGLDNVDIKAASKRGVVVMNTPEGNTITTAEHAIALLLALTRNIPEATASLKEGKWEKKRLKGREVFNKTLGLIGAGHIGRIVADRARGLKMKVIVYDPYISPGTIEKLDLEPVSMDELLARADYITIHTPKTEETANMINREALSRMKKGAMLINCARGGIVNEDDLYDALASGHLGGAALDVFSTEPPGRLKLMDLPNFICTPHLGASTAEAQDNVAKDVAEQIVAYLLHGTVKNAVNVPSISAELMNTLRPYVTLLERMGAMQTQLADSAIVEARVDFSGKVTDYDLAPLTTAMLKGLLAPILKDDVNFVNAPFIAAERGIKVVESRSKTHEDFASLIKLTVKTIEGENIVSGTIFGRTRPRIIRINDFYFEAIPEGHNLFIHSQDAPGVIGLLGTTLGRHGINISRMQVGQKREEKQNVNLITTNSVVPDEVLEEIRALDHVFSARRIEL